MPKKLHYCDVCKLYTLSEKMCPKCGGVIRTPHPPKFSPQDKYQRYRIPLFKQKMAERYKKTVMN
jgi:H/ACA ribonucleoprotein complex subunit 3